METLVKSDRIIDTSSQVLAKGVVKAIGIINEKIANEGWRGPKLVITEDKVNPYIANMTSNQRKKLRNKINRCIYKQGIRSINMFLHFLHRHVYKETTSVPHVEVSVKEEAIQTARKRYVEARNLAIKLYAEYKEEKGDFYKRKLNK
jgi:hypothetical protein